MGDAFIVRRGGGGAFAMILVNYPAGSTVTCTNSSGKKDISATQRLFYVKKSTLPISCVVSMTDGILSKSKTVNITYEGQSEVVTLIYELYLYDAGDEFTDVTGGWKTYRNCTLTKEAARLKMYPTVMYTDSSGIIGISNDVDFTCYNTLNFDAQMTGGTSGYLQIFVADTFNGTQLARYSFASDARITDGMLDVSSLTGTHKVFINSLYGDYYRATNYLYSMYLSQ